MKQTLEDNIEIADYIAECSLEEVDREIIEENYRGCFAVLKEVEISSLVMGLEDNHLIDNQKQLRYNKMTKEIPPIVIKGSKVIDGHHRVRALISKNIKTIMAYVVQENN